MLSKGHRFAMTGLRSEEKKTKENEDVCREVLKEFMAARIKVQPWGSSEACF